MRREELLGGTRVSSPFTDMTFQLAPTCNQRKIKAHSLTLKISDRKHNTRLTPAVAYRISSLCAYTPVLTPRCPMQTALTFTTCYQFVWIVFFLSYGDVKPCVWADTIRLTCSPLGLDPLVLEPHFYCSLFQSCQDIWLKPRNLNLIVTLVCMSVYRHCVVPIMSIFQTCCHSVIKKRLPCS